MVKRQNFSELRNGTGFLAAITSIILAAPVSVLARTSENLVPAIWERQDYTIGQTADARQAETHYQLGVELQQSGRVTEAIAEYRQAIRLNPKLGVARINLGAALATQGQFDAAIEVYAEAVRLQPELPEAYYNWGNALIALERVSEAISKYREAIRLQPDYANAYYNLGNALAMQERSEEAIAAWRQAITINPELAEAHGNLGLALYRQGRREEAVAALEKARDLFQQQGNQQLADRLERILQQLSSDRPAIS